MTFGVVVAVLVIMGILFAQVSFVGWLLDLAVPQSAEPRVQIPDDGVDLHEADDYFYAHREDR